MAEDNNFKQFDPTKNNMASDVTYNASSYRTNGAVAGVAPSTIHNKLFYQTSTFVAAFAKMMATIKNGGTGYEMSDVDLDDLALQLSNLVTVDQLTPYLPTATATGLYVPKNITIAKAGTYNINATTDMYKTFTTTGAAATTFVLPDPTTVASGAWVKIHNNNLWQVANITGVVSFMTNPVLGNGQEITIQCAGTSWIGSIVRAYTTPIGAVMPFAFEALSIFSGYLACDGATLNTADYPELFAAIGYNYGGSGATFNVPDLRGRFVRGYDTGAGRDVDAATRVRGDSKVGNYVGGTQDDEYKSHTHTTTFNRDASTGTSGNAVYGDENREGTDTLATNASGGSETRPKNMALIYGIKYVD